MGNDILFTVLQSFYKMITKNKPRQKEDFSNPDEDVDENREELIVENALLMERIQRNIIEAAEIHAETNELDRDIEKLQSELNLLTKNLSPELLAQIEQGYFDLDSDDNKNEGDNPDDEGQKLNSTLKKN